jgi:hypothetical protein
MTMEKLQWKRHYDNMGKKRGENGKLELKEKQSIQKCTEIDL